VLPAVWQVCRGLFGDGTHAYSYDALERMVLADGVSYGYDGDGVGTGQRSCEPARAVV
jgi:hypothetical protein